MFDSKNSIKNHNLPKLAKDCHAPWVWTNSLTFRWIQGKILTTPSKAFLICIKKQISSFPALRL